jgi:hypothetical protein
MNPDKRKILAPIVLAYADNAMGAIRTAGALLLGNSALVYFKVIGSGSDFVHVLILGSILLILGSLPVAAIINTLKKG